jgi:hypothetical protein
VLARASSAQTEERGGAALVLDGPRVPEFFRELSGAVDAAVGLGEGNQGSPLVCDIELMLGSER